MGDFSFLAPWRLLLLAVPIALLVAYVVVQRRRSRYAVRFTNMELLDSVAPDRPGWRRHIAAIGLLTGLVVASMAAARPAFATQESDHASIVMLAVDTSLSMEATDVTPSRLQAAQDAARRFLTSMPAHTRVGLVGFDGNVRVLAQPTEDHKAVAAALDQLRLGEGTAIGSAVQTSLEAIKSTSSTGTTTTTTAAADSAAPSATIVVLSDGETTVGVPNDTAAQEAAAAGVPVNTIAFGTDNGTVADPSGRLVAVPVNRPALARLAQQTSGQSLSAESAAQLDNVFAKLGQGVNRHPVTKEVGDWFAGGALTLLALAGVSSLAWFSRLP
ncbi:MAG TPA: VWA domain-containing protein [Acidimicrobiales bacterium]|nr:VWA domain-containing protein [Acidimicrobiales bacterium]